MKHIPKTALITGASNGIGRELAHVFAAHGHHVILVARNARALEELASELQKLHPIQAWGFSVDLADAQGPKKLFDEVMKRGGAPDFLVNNAGVGKFGEFWEAGIDEDQEMIQLNVTALTELTKRFLDPMIERGTGRILNVASTAAFQPGPYMAVYYATKAYVLSLSEALAEELSVYPEITVTTLCPGPTKTGFQKAAKMEKSNLFKTSMVMDARMVAQSGFEGLMAGRRIVVPGVRNQLLIQALRVSPRQLVTKIVKTMQKSN